jgi:hypothetical protein
MAKEQNADWWKSMIAPPTQRQWRQFERQQRRQFDPLMRFYQREAKRDISKDPIVSRITAMMGAEPSSEAISGAYSGALGKISDLIKGTDFAGMGKGVTGAVGAIGEALGVEGAGDVATAAGRVSGIGEGDDVFSKAILGGVASSYKGLEREDLKARADRLMQLGLSKGEAEKAARDERKAARQELAGLRTQRRGMMAQNPMERAMQFMQFGQSLRDYNRSGGYGGGFRGASSVSSPEEGDNAGGINWAGFLGGNAQPGAISPALPGGTGTYNMLGALLSAGYTKEEAQQMMRR